MPAPVIYTPPPFQRYFAFTADPNSAAGGSNLETIAADSTNFASGVIPDVTATHPVTTATHAWTPDRISRADEVSAIRAARPEVPFKVTPQLTWSAKAYRYLVEKYLKYGMGAEALTGAGPYVHTLTAAPFGASVLPSAMVQMIRDSVNFKYTGVVLESVNLAFGSDDAGTIEIEAHPLYAKLVTTAMPTGVAIEPGALPMVIRDAQVVYDGGASAAIGVSNFTFGYKNNGNYNRQVSGHCIDTNTIGSPALLRQLWFPHYHKLSARQTVTWGLDFLDTQQAQELAVEWGQVQKIVVTIGEPGVAVNQVVFNLFATEIDDGGASALTATGDETASFTGGAFYSASDGTDVSVAVTNATSTALT